jgi:hypothetical protein
MRYHRLAPSSDEGCHDCTEPIRAGEDAHRTVEFSRTFSRPLTMWWHVTCHAKAYALACEAIAEHVRYLNDVLGCEAGLSSGVTFAPVLVTTEAAPLSDAELCARAGRS